MRFSHYQIFPTDFLRSYVLSPLATREATRIYHVYKQSLRIVSLVVKEKFVKTSQQSQNIMEMIVFKVFFCSLCLY